MDHVAELALYLSLAWGSGPRQYRPVTLPPPPVAASSPAPATAAAAAKPARTLPPAEAAELDRALARFVAEGRSVPDLRYLPPPDDGESRHGQARGESRPSQ